MRYFTHERYLIQELPDGNRAYYKEFPHLTKTSCYYLNSFFDFDYDTEKYDVGVFKLQFKDGDFVVTSTKRSFRGRLSEIVSEAVTFNEVRNTTPMVMSVGERLYRKERITVSKLSDDPADKNVFLEQIKNKL